MMRLNRFISRLLMMLMIGCFANVSVASAALPEFYKGANPLAMNEVVMFKSTAEAAPEIRVPVVSNLTCTAGGNKGQTKGPKEVTNVILKFTGCKKGLVGCRTPGSLNAEEITSRSLKGVLVYIKQAAPTEVGLLLSAEDGGAFAIYKCTGFPTQTIGGSIIGEVLPLNEEKTEWKAIFSELLPANSGMQQFERYENEPRAMRHVLANCNGNLVLKDKEKMTWEPAGTEAKIRA